MAKKRKATTVKSGRRNTGGRAANKKSKPIAIDLVIPRAEWLRVGLDTVHNDLHYTQAKLEMKDVKTATETVSRLMGIVRALQRLF